MKLSGILMLPGEADEPVRLAPGSLSIERGRITDIEETTSGGGTGAGRLICPAFTDTHLHLPQFDIIGAHGLGLLDWLNKVTFPAEMRWADAGYAEAMTHRVIDQLFGVGTTGICAYATVHHESAMRAMGAVAERHMRGRIGQVLMDREAPPELIRPTEQLLEECRATLDTKLPGAVTPRFAVTSSEALLKGCGELAAEFGAYVQTHLSETVAECEFVRSRFGDDYVSVYEKAGLLGPRSIFGHGVHLDARDRARLAESGSVIAHCPLANSFLMSGTMDRAALLGDGVRISLGSDIGGGYERSMVRVGRAMIEAAAARSGVAIPAAQAWRQITAGNAGVGGWPDAGKLAVGAAADVLVIEPDVPWMDTADPLGTLMFAWDDRWLRQTIASGQVVYRAG